MSCVYYNEIDKYAAQWLHNLIEQDLIAYGDVDTRSISDVTPNDVKGYAQCHFFAGIGGWPLALRQSGVWPDHRAVWTGSCPCQPFSVAGKQAGFSDERHLWPHWQYLIEQCRPATILGEQVASATEWLRLVRGDLEALGYAVGAIPIEAASAGADHLRDRYWFVAHADIAGLQGRRLLPERAGERITGSHGMADSDSLRRQVDQDAGGCEERGGARPLPGFGGACDGDLGFSDCDRRTAGQSSAATAGHGHPIVPTGRDVSNAASQRSFPASHAKIYRQQEGDGSWDVEPERFDWVIGADGKARRVKPGIRLLAHGVPARVGKLRAFGNAIDPRPAAEFIRAVNGSIQ